MTVKYNPMTGARTDLEINAEDDGAAVAERWRKKRVAYLRTLIKVASPDACASYRRELATLQRSAHHDD